MRAPRVTIAVAVRDRREAISRCIDGILAQGGDFDVLVLDNGSTDGTAEVVRERARHAPVEIRVERIDGPLGAVRAAAVELARGEVIAFTDSDCVPQAGWLEAGVAALDADPRLGIVQGRTIPDPSVAEDPSSTSVHIEEETLLYECCNLFYRLSALRAARGFRAGDEIFYEDTTAGWSVRELGWRSRFVADAVVQHEVKQVSMAWRIERRRAYAAFPMLARRHPEFARAVLWGRVFLRPRSAAFTAAVLAALCAAFGRGRTAVVLLAPYLLTCGPEVARATDPLAAAVHAVRIDAAVFSALVSGSLRYRRLVL